MKQVITLFADIIIEYDVLIDGTLLYAGEYINLKQIRKYAYQWQKSDATRLMRWDNSPHHERLTSYPNHQHVMVRRKRSTR